MPEPADLVIIGAAGKMGQRALFAYHLVREKVRTEIGLKLAGVVDRKFSEDIATREVGRILGAMGDEKVPACDDFTRFLATWEPARTTVVYDASKSPDHMVHLWQAIEHGITYLGEKPLAITRGDLEKLQAEQNEFYCDFIETESLAFHGLSRHMEQNDFVIERMKFWRLGSTGLEKLVKPDDRGGVTGGALLDKADHDLSLTRALLLARLGNVTTADDELISCRVTAGNAIAWMPANVLSIDAFRNATPLFLNIFDGTTNEIGQSTADAGALVRTIWTVQGREVPVDYSFSWVGTELSEFDELKEMLDGMGFVKEDWLGSKTHEHERDRVQLTFKEEDTRIGWIEGRPWAGKGPKHIYVVSFLSKHNREPWAYCLREGDRRGADYAVGLPLEVDFGPNSLARIIRETVRNAVGATRTSTANFGKLATITIHKALIEMREEVLRRWTPYSRVAWNESTRRVLSKIQVTL